MQSSSSMSLSSFSEVTSASNTDSRDFVCASSSGVLAWDESTDMDAVSAPIVLPPCCNIEIVIRCSSSSSRALLRSFLRESFLDLRFSLFSSWSVAFLVNSAICFPCILSRCSDKTMSALYLRSASVAALSVCCSCSRISSISNLQSSSSAISAGTSFPAAPCEFLAAVSASLSWAISACACHNSFSCAITFSSKLSTFATALASFFCDFVSFFVIDSTWSLASFISPKASPIFSS
mmetsp:Transcript_29878/g.44126  ORF Transcript_29878/g.44126 Transcript_29878/m.44126 type:complete len:236 (+) Transcript_29878:671-1378(+)